MKTTLNLQERRLSDIYPAEYNPRVALKPGDPEYEKIKNSIEAFGYVDPIIINSDGTIIGGHQRYNVLLDLGYDTTQVVVVEATKEQEKALNIALNKITGQWDEEKLVDLLIELDLSDINMQLSGFTFDELENLKVKFDDDDAQEDEDFNEDEAIARAREETRTKRGDVWILGEHRLICGDARSMADMERLMDGAKADLYLTDPPYNVDYVGKTKDALKIENDRMTE